MEIGLKQNVNGYVRFSFFTNSRYWRYYPERLQD